MDLTQKQQAVFDYLKTYRGENGRPPSYEEIREEFGFASLNSADRKQSPGPSFGYPKVT